MSLGMPWSVKGIEPGVRNDVLHAAHAAGLTVGQWLNGVLRDTLVDLNAAGTHTDAYPAHRAPAGPKTQETAGFPMHYPAQQPYPYAPPPPYMAPPPPPHYAMPAAPYAAPYLAYPAAYPAPLSAPDPIEARLRSFGQLATDTAIGPVPGNDTRLLKVLDAAVGAMQNTVKSSEQKTAAAIEALATLMEKQRSIDTHARNEGNTQDAGREAARLAALQQNERARAAQQGQSAEVTQILSKLVERLNGLEESVASAHALRNEEALAQARKLEDRVGDALGAVQEDARSEEARGEVTPLPIRPPHRTVRPRITVPRASAAVVEIAARQRMLDAVGETDTASTQESAALDSIRKSIAALSDQVRDTARLRERRAEADLRHDLKELQRSVQELAPRQIVASVNESIRALAGKIEQSRREGVRENQLAPVEALLNEMRDNLSALRGGVDNLREPRGLNAINETLSLLARRVEAIGERSADSSQLGDIQRQMNELRTIVSEARQQQPLDGMHAQIAALADKLDAASERPRDTRVMSLLADAVEDVRNTMRKLDPETVFTRIERRLEGLEGLESRIDALSERLASDGTVRVAPVDLGGLTDRIEQMTRAIANRPQEADLSPILRRIDAMQEQLESRPAAIADTRSIEDVLLRLTDRIEAVRQPGSSTLALDELQAQMTLLADRLDRSTPNHPALGGLERTLSDLCQKVAGLQDTAASAAADAAKMVAAKMPAGGGIDPLAAEGMMLIKRDLTEIRSAQAESEKQARDLLAQVNASLDKIVGRLGSLEAEAARPRPMAQAPAPHAPVARAPVAQAPVAQAPVAHAPVAHAPVAHAPVAQAPAQRPVMPDAHPMMAEPVASRAAPVTVRAPEPASARQPAQAPAAKREAPTMAPLGDGDLDLPLEPGAGRAADSAADPRSSFIAAARRAAQTAAAQTAALAEAEALEAEAKAASGGRFDGIKTAIAARRKPMLLGLAAAIALIGGLKVANDFLEPDPQQTSEALPEPAAPRERVAEATPAAKAKQAEAAPATEQMAIANQAPPPATPGASLPGAAVPGAVVPGAAAPGQIAPSAPATAAPALASAPAATGDVAALLKQTNGALPEKLRQAATNGNPAAAYEIGARLAEGRGGVARDLKTAAKWLELAATQGFAPAQYRLGSFHREGLGVAKDSKQAFAWFEKAAQQGNILAMHNLAVLHAEGVNGAPDYAAAAQWFRNGAEHGVKDSQFNVAILYVKGLGVEQDMVEGYRWFAAAARQGDQDALKRRDEVLARLPADKAQTARQLGETFRAKKPDPRANEVAAPEGGWEDKSPLPTMARRAKSV